MYINEFLTSGPARPGGLSFEIGFGFAARRALDGLPLLTTANFPWTFWFPGIALNLLFPNASSRLPWQLGITIAIYVFLALTIKMYRIDLRSAPHDLKVAATGLFIVFPVLLWACMLLGRYNYLGDQRYYWPLLPLSIFVVYSAAEVRDGLTRTSFRRIIQTAGAIYIAVFIALNLVRIAFIFVPGDQGKIQRPRLFGNELGPWPSLAIAHELSPARRFVVALVKEEPNTLLLTSSKTGWFLGDAALDRSRIHELSCGKNLKASYLTGPARIVFLTFNEGEPQDLWAAGEQLIDGKRQPENADCFEQLPGLTLLQRFPNEGLKVLESRVPPGMRIKLVP